MVDDYKYGYWKNDEWEFKYVLKAVHRPYFEEIDDPSKEIDEIKEIKGEYEVVQTKDVLLSECYVMVNKEDGRVRFAFGDVDANVDYELSHSEREVNIENIKEDKIKIDDRYYPYLYDIVPDLEHREYKNFFDKMYAFFRETPVMELSSEKEMRDKISINEDYVLKEI